MEVYILYSNWINNGENVVNEVIGIYDCLKKAQHSLADCINTDLQYHPYEHISLDGSESAEFFNIPELAMMYYDDPNFSFDVTVAKMWDGDNEDCCEISQSYGIEERPVI